MNQLGWFRIISALFASVMMVVLSNVLGGLLYQPDFLMQPAYAIAGQTGPGTNLNRMRKSWPAALGKFRERQALYAYMSDIPEEVPDSFSSGSPVNGQFNPTEEKPLAVLLSEASVAEGERISRKCRTCHTFEKGGANGVGPNLWNIVGQSRAQVAGFNYTDAMKNFGGTWTIQDLFDYLQRPQAYIRGTNMAFAGLRRGDERAHLIAYLASLSDNPTFLQQSSTDITRSSEP